MSVSKPPGGRRRWSPRSRPGPNDTGLDGSVGSYPELVEIGTFPEPEATDLHQFVGGCTAPAVEQGRRWLRSERSERLETPHDQAAHVCR